MEDFSGRWQAIFEKTDQPMERPRRALDDIPVINLVCVRETIISRKRVHRILCTAFFDRR